MTIQQAYPIALRLRAKRPDLQDMDFSDLVAQIRSEGMGASGAGVEGLADLFATELSPSSPAPMQAARLVAPKPTAQIVPGANMARPDPRIPVGTTGQTLVASGLGRDLSDFEKEQIAGIKVAGAPQPDARSSAVAAAAPVREASPVAAAMAAAEAPAKPKFTSRLRPQYEAAQAELEQLTAQRDTLTAQGQPVDANITYGIQIKSGVASKLKAMVDAEEAAVVDAESAAVLERQTNRLTREEELVKQARKRARGDALIAFGGALAGAKAGEKFASVLTRGLVAGNESYTNARNAGEESSRTIEEKRDALIMKNRELIEKARADAINLANSGAAMTKAEMEFANLTQDGVDKLAIAPFKLSAAKSEATKLGVEAKYADQFARLEVRKGEAEITLRNAQAWAERNPGAGRAALADAVKPSATVYAELSDGVNLLTKIAADRLGSTPEARAAALAELPAAKAQLAAYGRLLGIGGAAPAGGKPAKATGTIVGKPVPIPKK